MLAAIAYPTIVKVHIGPFAISPHGVGIAVGFLLGARLMLPEANRKGITENDVYPLLTRAAIGAILGARLAYVLSHLTSDATQVGYIHHPLDIFKVWEGGISLLGGFIGAIALALPEMKRRRLSFWKLMDAAAPGMALGVIIGRIGDLIVGDHLGKQTSLFFGFKCPTDITRTASPCLPGPGAVVHQTAAYDFVLTIILLLVLLRLRRSARYEGFVITVFGAWYGCQRILEDFLREDRHLLPGLTGSQITSIIVVLVCLWHLIFVRHTPRWGRWDQTGDSTAGEPPTDGPAAEHRPAGEHGPTSDEESSTDDEPPPGGPAREVQPPLASSVSGESPENEE